MANECMGESLHVCDQTQTSANVVLSKTYREGHFARRPMTFTDEQKLFQCNTCQTNETIHIAMGKAVDVSDDNFWYDYGMALEGPKTA